MADWFIATEGVKVVKDSASLLSQIITGVTSAGAAFGGVWYGQWRITQREKEAAAAKLASERLFIATELVFLLEKFAQQCSYAAQESGSESDTDGRFKITYSLPGIDLTIVTGDWRSLPSDFMYRLMELPVLRHEAFRSVDAAREQDTPYDVSHEVFALNFKASALGLKVIRLSRSLRELCLMPRDTLSTRPWSAWCILSRVRGHCLHKLMVSRREDLSRYRSILKSIQENSNE